MPTPYLDHPDVNTSTTTTTSTTLPASTATTFTSLNQVRETYRCSPHCKWHLGTYDGVREEVGHRDALHLKKWFYRWDKPVVDMLSTSSYLPNLVPKSLNSFIPSKNIYVYDTFPIFPFHFHYCFLNTFPFSLFNPFYVSASGGASSKLFSDWGNNFEISFGRISFDKKLTNIYFTIFQIF